MIEDCLLDLTRTEKKYMCQYPSDHDILARNYNFWQLQFSVYYKEFFALYFALNHFAQFIWGELSLC